MSTEEAIAYAQRGRGERKRPSTGWGSLTPTELDVVRLVHEGIPNKDIATRLFVSPRTVQSHLRHVYNKLGLTSRVQLAQEAARQLSTAEIEYPATTVDGERPGIPFASGRIGSVGVCMAVGRTCHASRGADGWTSAGSSVMLVRRCRLCGCNRRRHRAAR